MEFSNNQTVIRDELSGSYELADVRKLATKLGLKANDLKREGKRQSLAHVASVVASRCNPFVVRDKLEEIGYDVSDILLDEYEASNQPSASDSQETGNYGNDGDGDGDGDGESKGEAEAEAGAETEDSGESEESESGEFHLPEGSDDSKEDSDDSDTEEDSGETEFNPDSFSEYFGNGQTKLLKELHEHHESHAPAGQSGGTFLLREPEGGLREIEGHVPANWQEILDLAMARKPIMLVGPTGCGKTTISAMVAESLNLYFASASCTEGMSENNLTGWLLPVGDSGKFVYVTAQFVKCFEEGGVFLLDEVDASDPNVLVVLHTAIANKWMDIPQRHENPRAIKHPDFVLIAAANTYGNGADMQFVGRNQLDEATLDRFRIGTVTMDYDANVESQLINSEVLEWGRAMRERLASASLKKSLSTRYMIDCSNMYSVNAETYGQSYWEDKLMQNWSRDEISRVS